MMFKGSVVALVTPFNPQGEVDDDTLRELIEWQIESGTDAIVLCGSTGEAPTLSQEETIRIFREGVSIARGRIPVIAGTGCNDTLKSVRMTQMAKNVGVDAALVIVPYYNRPTPEGCFQHFQELSKVGLPVIVYHHPIRTGIKLSVSALARIMELPHMGAVKDATGDLDYVLELMHQIKVPVLTGDDGLVIPMMASGASGVISVVANLIPQEWKMLTALMNADEVSAGRELFQRYYPLVKTMFLETNPQCVKFALGAMGKCSSSLRLPLLEPGGSVRERILDEMGNAGLILQSSYN